MTSLAPSSAPLIRVAGADDLDVVVSLLAELIDELGPSDVAMRVKPKLRPDLHAALGLATVRIMLAEVDGAAAGLVRGDILTRDPIFRLRDDHRCGYVDQMYVRPPHRGHGLGQALLEAIEGWFRSCGVGHALLHGAPKALRFYTRAGYLPNREMFKRL